jgi:opacity protein-like surface antigen
LNAQWEVGVGGGVAMPITGYKEVLKTGWLLNGEGKYRFGKGAFAVGMKTHFTRLQKDKNPNDTFQNARMTTAPVIFTAEYGIPVKGSFQPYITGGLGITLFSLNYDTSPTTGTSDFNVSFTMMPLIGLRYVASKNIYPFIEAGLILLADGAPIGFPQGEKMTGYNSIVAGVQYRF